MEWMVNCGNTSKETSNTERETNSIIALCREKINRMKIIEKFTNTERSTINFTAQYYCDKNRVDIGSGGGDINKTQQTEINEQNIMKFNQFVIKESPCTNDDTRKSKRSAKNVKFKVKYIPEFTNSKPCVLPKGLPIAKGDSVDFDDVLLQLGEFGRYQKILFLSMLLFAFSEAFVYFAQIFITVIPDHWCRVPEISHLDFHQRYVLITIEIFFIIILSVGHFKCT